MAREQEKRCIELVSKIIGGAEFKRGYTFEFLRGDVTPHRSKGVKLPVDAYFPQHNLVVEFREKQHYGDRVALWDNRVTATGMKRKKQRSIYDKRREEILPKNGIKLLIIEDREFTGTLDGDIIIRNKIRELGINC